MPTWPTVPGIDANQVPSIFLAVLKTQFDQGYEQTRARHTRGRRRYVVQYTGLTTDQYHLLQTFVEETIFGSALPFDFVYPNGTTVSDATNATPIVLTTAFNHGVVTNDRVEVAGVLGNTAANGTFTAEQVTATTITLTGSVGNGVYTGGGTVALTFENTMSLALPSDTLTVTELLGPIQDASGVLAATFLFEERF